jgi:hypothetical protein
MRDTQDALFNHLGGEDRVTEPQRLQCRRVSVFEAELVFLEDKFGHARAEGSEPRIDHLDLIRG